MKDLRIAIIGLDGANKTTAKLVGINTEIHDFISTIPPYTPPSWTSILTGVNPAKHGVIGWQRLDKKTNRVKLTTSKDVMYPRLSELLEKANLRSVLINLPMTYPFSGIRKKDKTIIVSDWVAPSQEVFPKKLESRYREFLVDPPHEWAKFGKKEYPKRVREYTETRLNLYYDLLERVNWNLYFIVFSETDWFSHIFPQILEGKDKQIVAPTFKLINDFIETAKSIVDAVFIVSDHGFEVKRKVFYVNEALAENGFIRYSKTKARFVKLVKQVVPEKILKRVIEKTGTSASAMSYVSQIADAFMIEDGTWGVYLTNNNVKKVREALKEYNEVFDVFEFKAIHKGPYSNRMPDLAIIPENGVELSNELNGKISEKVYKGDHEIHGVFSAYGDDIKETIPFEKSPKVYDVVPTVFHIFGLPIPQDTDGRVLKEIFKDGSEYATRKPSLLQ